MTDAAVLSFTGVAHAYAYLLNTSITLRIYLNPLLKEACMSTKSADHISSLLKTITDRLGTFLLIGLCNSSANFSFQLPSWYLVPIIGLTINFFSTFSPNVLLSLEDNLPHIFLSHSFLGMLLL